MRSFDRDEVSGTIWGTLEKLGDDWKGKFCIRIPKHYKGFYLFSDQSSNCLKAYLCKNQRCLLDCLKDFLYNVVLPSGRAWRVLQSDRSSNKQEKKV
jgi:hypothetical protein